MLGNSILNYFPLNQTILTSPNFTVFEQNIIQLPILGNFTEKDIPNQLITDSILANFQFTHNYLLTAFPFNAIQISFIFFLLLWKIIIFSCSKIKKDPIPETSFLHYITRILIGQVYRTYESTLIMTQISLIL
jgi:hypothetical protein